jgi:tRNA pseudouridine55 synthase
MTPAPARFIVLDKPAGVTSFDMVREVRRVTGIRRVGHGGTLDPFATGVLVVAVGTATRLLAFLGPGHKRYRLTVRFGQSTDSHDATGQVTAEGQPRFDTQALRAALPSFLGRIQQRPPAVSALKVEGRRAYRLQRQGLLTEDLPPRAVEIHSIELLDYQAPDAVLRVRCGGGTYMRALARDLGEALGCPAHAAALDREAVGPFERSEAIDPRQLPSQWPAGPSILAPVAMARAWPRHVLAPAELERIRHGGAIEAAGPAPPDQPIGLLTPAGALAAVAVVRGESWQPTVVLTEAEHGRS